MFGSSRSGRPSSARSTTVVSNPPWARVRSANHRVIGSPARPGRVEPATIIRLGMEPRSSCPAGTAVPGVTR